MKNIESYQISSSHPRAQNYCKFDGNWTPFLPSRWREILSNLCNSRTLHFWVWVSPKNCENSNFHENWTNFQRQISFLIRRWQHVFNFQFLALSANNAREIEKIKEWKKNFKLKMHRAQFSEKLSNIFPSILFSIERRYAIRNWEGEKFHSSVEEEERENIFYGMINKIFAVSDSRRNQFSLSQREREKFFQFSPLLEVIRHRHRQRWALVVVSFYFFSICYVFQKKKTAATILSMSRQRRCRRVEKLN